MDKVEARRLFRKKSIPKNVSLEVIGKLEELDEYKSAHLVLAYYPMADEIDIRLLERKSDKRFAYPVAKEDGVMHFAFEDGTEEGKFGLRVPSGERLSSFGNGTVIIMPALAYDKAMGRIGRGGGYYDRFIKEHPGLIKIGVIPSERLIDEVITEDYDAKADIILTEKLVLRIEAL